jgi:hypothetical protein
MKPGFYRFAEKAVPLAIMAGAVACSPMMSSPPDYGIRPVSTAANPDVPADMGYYSSAVDAINKRDYGLALNFLQAARASDPNSARVLNAFGVVYDKLGRFDLSTRYYAQAKVADPQSPIVARNTAYSQVLQHLLNGDVTPSQLAAVGPSPRPPVVIETQTEILPGVTKVAAQAAPTPAPVSDAGQSGTSVGDPSAQSSDQILNRPVVEAKIDVPGYRSEDLIVAAPVVPAEQLPQVKPFAVTAQASVPQDSFLFPARLAPDVAEKASPLPVESAAPAATNSAPRIVIASQPEPARVIAPQAPVLSKIPAPQLVSIAPDIAVAPAPLKEMPAPSLTVAQLVRSNESVPNLVPQASALAALSTEPVRLTLAAANSDSSEQPSVKAHVSTARKTTVRILGVLPPNAPRIRIATIVRAPVSASPAVKVRQANLIAPALLKKAALPSRVQFAMLQQSARSAKPAAGAAFAVKFALLTHHPLVIVNASARKNADDSIRRALIRHNWTVAQGRVELARKESFTTLFYHRADYAVAKALARTLDLPMHLIPNGCHCVGLRLVIGTNALNRRYSELQYAGPHHMLSAATTSLDFGLSGAQRW